MIPTNPIDTSYGPGRMPAALAMNEGTLRSKLNGLDERAEAEAVAKQLESTFLSMMLSAMRDTVQESGLFGDDSASKMYQQMLDDEYVQLASDRWELDFHETLVRQILDPTGEKARSEANSAPPPDSPRKK